MFDIATKGEVFELWNVRAKEWAEHVSAEAYVGRNKRLAKHPFGEKRITTYVWRENNEIVTSFDTLEIDFIVNLPDLHRRAGVLMASLVTPEKYRKKGYAESLFKAFFTRFPDVAAVGYSEIDPRFYNRHGLIETHAQNLISPVVETDFRPETVSMDDGIRTMDQLRWERVRKTKGPALAVHPDALFLDWQIERYRYFAELGNRELPKRHFWRWHETWVLAVPDYTSDMLDVLWTNEADAKVLSAIAKQVGVSSFQYWGKGEGKDKLPMARYLTPAGPAAFLDPQLCDWW